MVPVLVDDACFSVQWRRDERTALSTDVGKMTQNVSVDVVTGDHLRRQHHRYNNNNNNNHHQQQQQGDRYYYTSTLSLRSTVTHDSGTYVCTATNNNGFVERRAYLHVVPSSGEPEPKLSHTRAPVSLPPTA